MQKLARPYSAIILAIFCALFGVYQDAKAMHVLVPNCQLLFKLFPHALYGYGDASIINRPRLETAREVIKGGKKITPELLQFWGVPKELHQFYNLDTGEFNYRPTEPRRLSLENGDEELLTMQVNTNAFRYGSKVAAVNLHLLRDLRSALETMPDLQLALVGSAKHADVEKVLQREFPKELRNRVHLLDVDWELNSWAQDWSKPLEGRAGVLVPTGAEVDGKIAVTKLNSHLGDSFKFISSPLYFDGGDVVVGKDHVFLGANSIESNMRALRISRDEAINALSAEFSKPVIEFSNRGQAISFHADLAMAVVRDLNTKREVILLESVELTAKLLFKNKRGFSRSAKHSDESTILKIFSQSKEDAKNLNASERSLYESLMSQGLENLRAHEEALDNMASEFLALGYDVRRIPGLCLEPKILDNLNKDSAYEHFQYLSWANVVVSQDTVLVPDLGLPVMDDYVNKVFKKIGYKNIVPMKFNRESLCRNGGTRCAIQTFRQKLFSD